MRTEVNGTQDRDDRGYREHKTEEDTEDRTEDNSYREHKTRQNTYIGQ